LGRALQLSQREIQMVSLASMVHDIGKLAIPESVLEKVGELSEEEYRIMQDHIIYGYNILSKSPGEFMNAAAIIAQQHHEKYDGTGYLKFRGEHIHPYARLVAVADVLDALLSDRPYKTAWMPDEAFAYLNEQSGKHFDPQLVILCNQNKTTLLKAKYQPQRIIAQWPF
jgi:HD-GYP domain-containing protein (c-di-GMP phosphodiesterase class II)